MDLLFWALGVFGVTPEDGVALVGSSAKELERGGLYSVIAVLLLGLIVMFVIKERQLTKHDAEKKKQLEDKEAEVKDLHGLIITMVERSTAALTEANMNMRKIEIHLERFTREQR